MLEERRHGQRAVSQDLSEPAVRYMLNGSVTMRYKVFVLPSAEDRQSGLPMRLETTEFEIPSKPLLKLSNYKKLKR
jgi:hypothetical protein